MTPPLRDIATTRVVVAPFLCSRTAPPVAVAAVAVDVIDVDVDVDVDVVSLLRAVAIVVVVNLFGGVDDGVAMEEDTLVNDKESSKHLNNKGPTNQSTKSGYISTSVDNEEGRVPEAVLAFLEAPLEPATRTTA
jgi:hypothetical protein